MAAKPFVRTSTLQQSQSIVDKDGRPVAWFVRLINDNNGNVTEAINQIAQLPAIQEALLQLDAATQAANAAAAAAQTAAEGAQSAADGAQTSTDAQKREAALQGSYIEPDSVLSATTTMISVAAHTRRYADGTSANVLAGTVPATTMGDIDYVSYEDPARTGGAVAYIVSTTAPAQTGDTHVVGAVTIPIAGTANGGRGPRKPGFVEP